MKQRFFAWLARQLWPYLEPQIQAEATRIAASMQPQVEQPAQPRRKFIGQP